MHDLKIVEQVNDTFVDYADFINITMPMHNLIQYSDSCSDTSGTLWDFQRDETVNNANVTNDDNATSFKYKQVLLVIQQTLEYKME